MQQLHRPWQGRFAPCPMPVPLPQMVNPALSPAWSMKAYHSNLVRCRDLLDPGYVSKTKPHPYASALAPYSTASLSTTETPAGCRNTLVEHRCASPKQPSAGNTSQEPSAPTCCPAGRQACLPPAQAAVHLAQRQCSICCKRGFAWISSSCSERACMPVRFCLAAQPETMQHLLQDRPCLPPAPMLKIHVAACCMPKRLDTFREGQLMHARI